jgi:hypothetical protein
MERKCGKCDGCVMPVAFEVDNKALSILEDWFHGRRKLSDENLAKVIRLVERRRYETEVLEQAYMKGVCRFPDMLPRDAEMAVRAWRSNLVHFSNGGE